MNVLSLFAGIGGLDLGLERAGLTVVGQVEGTRGRDVNRSRVGADVANTDRAGLEGTRVRRAAAERGPVADADSVRLDRRRGTVVGDAGHVDDRRARTGWDTPTADPWWASEPDVGRVAHGVPHRVDRLRALGNAVVPQVAEHIGRLLIQATA